MKLYTAVGPSARTVRMLLAEKGVELPQQEIDIMRGENRSDAYLNVNPDGQLPALELEDGFVLAESLAICEYLEEAYPRPPLIGIDARQRAETRMWCRRIDLRVMEPSILGFKASEGQKFFKDHYYLVVNGARELKTLSGKNLAWLNRTMEGKPYICGERFSLADIQLYCFCDYNRGMGNPIPSELGALSQWFTRVSDRDSASASIHPSELNR